MLSFLKEHKFKFIGYGLLLIIGIIFPIVSPNRYYLTVATLGFIYAIAVYGLNLIVGYLGQLSLAQAGFFGLGAYTSGLLMLKMDLNFWLALPLAAIITTILAVLVGLISFRTKGHYFVILTLCIGVIINLVIEKWDSLTGGVRGLIGIPLPNPIGPLEFKTLESQYYLVFVFLLITIYVMNRISSSLLGRTFRSIRNSEDLASTLGINVMYNKLLGFAIAAFFTGIAGALYASYIRFLGPEISTHHLTFEFLLFLLIGGQATVAGPLVGTLIASVITESLQFAQEYRMVIFGLMLILIVRFFPGGAVGEARKLKVKVTDFYNRRKAGNYPSGPGAGSSKGKLGVPSKGESHVTKN